ncbi:hypothetical protein [Desulfoferrobacter suflitae]|uniref:hypothetical protein n=1 Tax=Desulfoferrobacter suflitae TaxID=2865782 RepID=UPI0021644DD7|nr:hypothetical protein [Desulfoferrobacter suflitae]MCK8603614.1 hypothetical protein [Desulfoferrobacter suflitae]
MHTHMDRTIFHLRASVPATSLYLLICSLLDEGQTPTLKRTKELWNGSEEEFQAAIQELTQRGILVPPRPMANGRPAHLDLTSNWRRMV